jgi:hypothetical protein
MFLKTLQKVARKLLIPCAHSVGDFLAFMTRAKPRWGLCESSAESVAHALLRAASALVPTPNPFEMTETAH